MEVEEGLFRRNRHTGTRQTVNSMLGLWSSLECNRGNGRTFREPCPFWMIVVEISLEGLLEEAEDGKRSLTIDSAQAAISADYPLVT